tara:strand:- start:822 stop:1484 length:663 start_codon:yes stop_codon:yes gene_type:complete
MKKEEVENFLRKEMPGDWKKKHITELSMCMPYEAKFYRTPGLTECVHNTFGEIERLFDVIHTENLNDICDPFSGTGTISEYIKEKMSCINIVTNDICDKHGNPDFTENALDNSFYEQFGQPFDAIITSPWFSVLDIAIPIMLKHVKYFIAVHVPAYYITNAHDHRIRYLKRFIKNKQIYIVGNLPHAVIGWRCVWLIIFKDRHIGKMTIKKNLKGIDYFV